MHRRALVLSPSSAPERIIPSVREWTTMQLDVLKERQSSATSWRHAHHAAWANHTRSRPRYHCRNSPASAPKPAPRQHSTPSHDATFRQEGDVRPRHTTTAEDWRRNALDDKLPPTCKPPRIWCSRDQSSSRERSSTRRQPHIASLELKT